MPWRGLTFLPGFSDGYAALVIVTLGSAVSTLFSLAPSYLKYVSRGRYVVGMTASCVATMILLTWQLGAVYEDVGATFVVS